MVIEGVFTRAEYEASSSLTTNVTLKLGMTYVEAQKLQNALMNRRSDEIQMVIRSWVPEPEIEQPLDKPSTTQESW
jgi:hypothetical protein